MRKKILITASTFPRWEGDTEPRFILDYAKSMQAYYDVTVLAPAAIGAADKEVLEGVEVIRYHYFPIHKCETLCYPGAIVPRVKEKKVRGLLIPFLFASLWFKLRKLSKQYDAVHAHWVIPQGIIQSGIKGTPYIITGHGADITSLNFWPVKNLKLKTLKNAKYITVVSGALNDYVQSVYPNDKTKVIPMGCDTSAFRPEYKLDNYFGQGDKKAVLFVGRLAEKKGVTYLIDAMKSVDNAVLYIVGKGNLEDDLRKQAEELGDKVCFMGPKTHEELKQVYASADVFVAPSITAKDGDKEGFGLVILEALSSGVPVVASNSGGIPDIITDGYNGLLCEEKDVAGLANAINKVLTDSATRQMFIENGLKTAEYNSYSEVGRRYYEVIEENI
ncbi:MAG: glycosyltransferase family 4 protein [Saccharofermentans sp.]|nr:glycosyltransferase family 4 protein [Saccharofermentans sp.]